MADIRTDKEKQLQQRHEKICKMYQKLMQENPQCPPHRAFDMIAAKVDMSGAGVRHIIMKAGLYERQFARIQ